MKYITKSRKALSTLKKKEGGGVNNFGLVFAKRPTIYHTGRVCYNVLRYENTTWGEGKGPVSFISTIRPLNESLERRKEMVVNYLDWVFQDSPFASVFFTKSGAFSLKEGMICHTDVSSSLLIGGLGLPREINECSSKVLIWGNLVDLGMSPLYAYIATYFLENMSNQAFEVKKPVYNSNHLSLTYPLSSEYMKNFCRKAPSYSRTQIFNTNSNFQGVFALWGGQRMGEGYKFKYSKVRTDIITTGWNGEKNVTSSLVYETEDERREFVEEFSRQMKEICYG